jgi:uncharacterized protein with PQ loop repeat
MLEMKASTVERIGWFAAMMAVAMFVSYIDQIRLNLNGQPGSFILPMVTTVNCSAWIAYAMLKHKVDWPILFCNTVGFVVSIITAVTSIL